MAVAIGTALTTRTASKTPTATSTQSGISKTISRSPRLNLTAISTSTSAIADHAIHYLREHADEHSRQSHFSCTCRSSRRTFPSKPSPTTLPDTTRRTDRAGMRSAPSAGKRIRSLGMISGELSPVERDLPPPVNAAKTVASVGPGEVDRRLPWAELTPVQQNFQAAKMAVYAAMVDRMDQEIGHVLDQLRSMNALDNTVVVLLSDNGASPELTIRGDGHDPAAPPGSAATFLCEGPTWSTVSNTPFRRSKMLVHEGGIATPLVVHWPAGIAARGEFRRTPGHVIDIVPTVLELAGSDQTSQHGSTRPGVSLVPDFTRDGTAHHQKLWWLHQGNRALRRGDWKIVAVKGGPWELYDLATDRTETKNLADKRPELVAELAQLWTNQLKTCQELATSDDNAK